MVVRGTFMGSALSLVGCQSPGGGGVVVVVVVVVGGGAATMSDGEGPNQKQLLAPQL